MELHFSFIDRVYQQLREMSQDFKPGHVLSTTPIPLEPPFNYMRLAFRLITPNHYESRFLLRASCAGNQVAKHLHYYEKDTYRCTDETTGSGYIFRERGEREPIIGIMASAEDGLVHYVLSLGDQGVPPAPLLGEDVFTRDVNRLEKIANLVTEGLLMALPYDKLRNQGQFNDMPLTLNVL